jgi:glycosyltransferase involved in cell wall biosynthesis
LGVAVQLIDLPEWGPARLPPERRDPWFDTLGRDVRARTILHCTLPIQVRPDPRKANVNYTMFEATPIPRSWAAASGRVDRIVTPTASSVAMWQAAGVAGDRLAVSPLGIDAVAFAAIAPGEVLGDLLGGAGVWERRVRFLTIAEVSGRKNLPGLLRAWRRATTPEDDAVLILKPGLYNADARPRLAAMLAAAGLDAGTTPVDAAPVQIIDRLFGDAEMPSFIGSATHYISLSFGEGWDQPMVEAGAAGLRLIAPAHSAYLAHLDAGCATLLPSVPVPSASTAEPELQAFFGSPGMTWWQPDEDAAVAAIRAAIEGRDGDIASPRERIMRDLTWERAAFRLLEVLTDVEASRARRRFWPGAQRSSRG